MKRPIGTRGKDMKNNMLEMKDLIAKSFRDFKEGQIVSSGTPLVELA